MYVRAIEHVKRTIVQYSQSIQLLPLDRGLDQLLCSVVYGLLLLKPRLHARVLLKEVGHVWDKVLDHVHVWQRVDLGRLARVRVNTTGEGGVVS